MLNNWVLYNTDLIDVPGTTRSRAQGTCSVESNLTKYILYIFHLQILCQTIKDAAYEMSEK